MTVSAQVPATRSMPGPGLARALVSLLTTGGSAPNPSAYTAFVIVVQARADPDTQVQAGPTQQWLVARRYSEFRRLHQLLTAKFATLPALPPTRPIWNLDPVFVEERRQALDRYLADLLGRKAVARSDEIQLFLQMADHGVSLRDPTKLMAITVLTDQMFAIRALDGSDHVIVTGCEDTAIFNRVDSLLTNTRLPWEKQGAIVPVGCLNVWSQRDNAEWSVSASAYFQSAVTSVAYDPRHRQAFAALSSGVVQAYTLNMAYTQLMDERSWAVHRRRIVQAQHLRRARLLITCSLDNTLAMTDTHSSQLVARSHLGTTVLAFEVSADERWLVAGTAQSVCVVDLSENHLRITRHLTEPIACPISAMHFRPAQKSSLLFTSCDRICTIYALSKPDPSLAAYRRIAELDQGPTSSITKIAVCSRSSQIVTAHQNGCMAVWDGTAPGLIKYVIHAHDAEITALQWVGQDRLVSASMDGCVKFWRFPNSDDGAALTTLRTRTESGGDESRPAPRSVRSDGSSRSPNPDFI